MSPSRWWVLGLARCGSGECPQIEATRDAGISFESLPAPGGRIDSASTVPQIAFANAEDGWVFGPKLYATTDGGRQWRAISVPGTVTGLASGIDDAFAVVEPPPPACARSGHCSAKTTPKAPLWTVRIGSDDWRPDPATRSHGASVGLAVHGRSIWVIDTSTSRDGLAVGSGLLHSADDGARFTVEPERVGGVQCDYAPASNTVVWAYCSGGHFMFAGRSTDAGAHFHSVGPTSTSKATPNGYPNGSSLEAASPPTAVAASDVHGRSALIRTVNAGRSWQVVHPSLNRDGYWEVLGFTTTQVGYALWTGPAVTGSSITAQLWRTANGGATWSSVAGLR